MATTENQKRWAALEQKVTATRKAKCSTTLSKLLGGKPTDKHPRVGMAFSGGGWRAMTSAVALMDALSIPLDASETVANEEGIKLLDIITHIFGLSGGSWAAFVALAGGDRNPFHHDATDKSPISEQDRQSHPWLHGQHNKFDPDQHQYKGLIHMTDAAHVSKACYRGGASTLFVSMASNVADTTFGSALATRLLGATLVERWSNFLANDILSFKDGGELKEPTKEAKKKAKDSEIAANNSINGEDTVQSAADVAAAVAVAKDVASKDPNIGSKARSIKLSDLRPLIETGDFPFVCNTAIANKPKDSIQKPFNNATRLYDWVEFSPYFIRNTVSDNYTEDVDNCGCYFTPAPPPVSADGSTSQAVAPPPRHRSEMRLHNYMAVCGSAFACDVGALLPKGVADTIRDTVKLKSSPIVGGGLTEIIYGKEENSPACVCRDAGIDFNVPFPPMLHEAHREFDIIIAMDAGADSYNAYELQRAVELGYLKLEPTPNPLEVFPEGNRVRVYKCVNGGPTIIYFLGLTERPTGKIIHRPHNITHDTSKIRTSVMNELIPILLSELRLRHSGAMMDSGLLATTSGAGFGNTTLVVRPIKYNPKSSRNNRVPNADTNGDEDADPSTPYGSAFPPVGNALVPASGGAAFPAMGNKQEGFSGLAQTIINSAASQGMIRDSIDAFFIVEKAVLASLPQVERRRQTVALLETEAISIVASTPIKDTTLKQRLTDSVGADIVESLAQIGVLKKLNWSETANRNVELAPEWVDFYVATSLVRHLLPAANLDDEKTNRVLCAMNREGVFDTSPPNYIESVFIQSRSFKTNSRMCTLLGSLASKLSKYNCDVSGAASVTVAKRYLAQVEFVHSALAKTPSSPKTKNDDSFELAITKMCENLVDFFTEMLSFSDLNLDLILSAWDIAVLKSFVATLRSIFDGLNEKQHNGVAFDAVVHGLLLAETIAKHPSECSLVLLRVLAGEKGCKKSIGEELSAALPHLGSPSKAPQGAINSDTKGIVRLAIQNPSVRKYPEDVLRIVEAAFSSPDGYKAKRDEIQSTLNAVPNRPPTDPSFTMNLEIAYANCFAAAIRTLIRGDQSQFDNYVAVTKMIACKTHYATMQLGQNKRNAIFVLWTEAAATSEFRSKIASDCIASLELFDFISGYAHALNIPANLNAEKIDYILNYAEKYKGAAVKKLVAADTSQFSKDQKERYDRFNNALLDAAHSVLGTAADVKGAVTDKIGGAAGKVLGVGGDVAGKAFSGVKGFFGKK